MENAFSSYSQIPSIFKVRDFPGGVYQGRVGSVMGSILEFCQPCYPQLVKIKAITL